MIDLKPCAFVELCIPRTTPTTQAQIIENMKANGYCSAYPIVLWKGQILLGRARYNACASTGTMPATRDYAGEAGAAETYAFMDNMTRLTERQRTICAAMVSNHFRMIDSWNDYTKAQKEATESRDMGRVTDLAKMSGLSEGKIRSARKVFQQGCLELMDAVKDGIIGLTSAAEISGFRKDKQRRLLDDMKTRKQAIEIARREFCTDQAGKKVPDHMAHIFTNKMVQKVCRELTMLATTLRNIKKWNPFVEPLWIGRMEDLRRDIEAAKPWVIHDACEGNGCDDCRQLGWKSRGDIIKRSVTDKRFGESI